MGRKLIQLDLEEIGRLAGAGLSEREICAALGIGNSTLTRRKHNGDFEQAIKRGRAKAHEAVANKLFEACEGGDITAIIWWEKTRNGMSNRIHLEGLPQKPVLVSEAFADLDDDEVLH